MDVAVETTAKPGRRPDHEAEPRERLSPKGRAVALAIARGLFPTATKNVPPVTERTIDRAEKIVSGAGAGMLARWEKLVMAAEHTARAQSRGRAFSSLPTSEASALLERWQNGNSAVRALAYALTGPIKIAHLDDPRVYLSLGCTYRWDSNERPAYMDRVVRGAEMTTNETVECDVVVVGTGAGGAVVAKELASRGLAVLLLEEGEYNGRPEFNGRAIEGVGRLWRDRGATGTLGNAFIPIPLGRTVGGSTAINTGTCWRAPDWVLDRWADELGLWDLAPDRMRPYYERVEQELGVARANPKYLGGVARVVARGCDALGYSHRALDRNAPDCDGAGVCDFGCPTDARRSTNVSYVPAAIRAGAELRTGLRAERVILENGRAAGVVARSATGHELCVRARATVLACGAMITPVMLERQGLGRRLPHLGKNLSVHPATVVSGLFDEEVRGYAAIPQGYCVDHFHDQGILFMGAAVPIDLAALQFPLAGDELVRVLDRYDGVATMGVMIEDASRGSVRAGPGGKPIASYWLGREERERLRRGVEIMSRIFLAAGAREIFTGVHGHRRIDGPDGLAKLRGALPAAGDFVMMAFHPLGTCRMARSPEEGVVSPEHEVFGTKDLFVVDGSVVPSAPAVNPQETIMALAARAGEHLARRLEAA